MSNAVICPLCLHKVTPLNSGRLRVHGNSLCYAAGLTVDQATERAAKIKEAGDAWWAEERKADAHLKQVVAQLAVVQAASAEDYPAEDAKLGEMIESGESIEREADRLYQLYQAAKKGQ